MLRTLQEEQTKYFHLDRKLGSGNLNEVGEALDEIALCLGRMRKLDLVNSLVMRMLELMHTVRSFHVKQRLADVFRHHAALLASTHSRDEIAAVLTRCLKGSDQYTRMMAMEMVAALPGLFLKDIAVYHTLLAKLSLSNTASKEEKKGAVLCLARLLSASSHLSRLFSKNLGEI
jgi:N-acyl-D-aspartate/D-glutamate deacylase